MLAGYNLWVNQATQQQTNTTEADIHTFEIGHIVQVVRKRIWAIAAFVAVGLTGAVLYNVTASKVYETSATVIIDPQPPQVFGSKVQEVIQLGSGTYWSNKEYYNTQIDILGSYDLARVTIAAHEFEKDPRLALPRPGTKEEQIDFATKQFHRAMNVTRNAESRIVKVGVRHTDANLAVSLANKHVETYIDYTRGLRTKGSGKVSQFLAKELDSAEARLRASEEKLNDFIKENGILSVSLEDKRNILAKDLARYTEAISDARVRRIELESLLARVKQYKGKDVLESPVFGLTSRSTLHVDSTMQQYIGERQRLTELAQELGERHPKYKSQKGKVEELYSTLKTEEERVIRELGERYKVAVSAENKFQAEVKRLKSEAFELGPKSVEYNRYKRQQESDAENYQLVLGRLRTSELSGRNRAVNIRPHTVAREAVQVSPRVALNIAFAIVLSLMLGAGLAFTLEHLDRTLKTAEDVEVAVGTPLLGIIPMVSEVSAKESPDVTKDRDLWVFTHPSSVAAECCRSIRTNILFSAADRPLKTLTISSPRPREGKTTSTIYLGTAMAQSGQKVLLIDTDLRRPRLHKSLGVSKTTGVTNLILGNCSISDTIRTTDIPNLYVLPSGPQPPNPAELLMSNRFRDVLRTLGQEYDRILLDSPPILAVTDGVVLARMSDGVILVAQAGRTSMDDAAQSARQIADVHGSILGMILNDMNLSDRRYGYYRYEYGYSATPGDTTAATGVA